MLRRWLAVLFSMPFGLVIAQSWCPPGATWHYEYADPFSQGAWNQTYVGDTLIDGYQAQHIVANGMIISDPITFPITGEEFTALVGALLLVRIEDPPNVVWDTLLRFDALPGDQWFIPGHDLICSEISTHDLMQVLDTGHVVVDGVTLRYWDFGFFWSTNPLVWAGRYFERYGHPHMFIPYPTCGAATEGSNLSCYRDDELIFPSPFAPSNGCNITLNAPERTNGHPAVISPNPGTDHFSISLPPGGHVITLFDALGQQVMQQHSSSGQFVLDAHQLPSGIYTVRVDDGSTLLRWVKE